MSVREALISATTIAFSASVTFTSPPLRSLTT